MTVQSTPGLWNLFNLLRNTRFPFFDLPAELREMIYEDYFRDMTIASKNLPGAKACPSLLLANRQLYHEAKKFMFREAIFSINMGSQYSTHPGRDMSHYFGQTMHELELFAGRPEVFFHFKKFRLILDSPKRTILLHREHWQQSLAVLLSTVSALDTYSIKTYTIAIGLGPLNPKDWWLQNLLVRRARQEDHERALCLQRSTIRRSLGLKTPRLELPANGSNFKINYTLQEREAMTQIWALCALLDRKLMFGDELMVQNCSKGRCLTYHGSTVFGLLSLAFAASGGDAVRLVLERSNGAKFKKPRRSFIYFGGVLPQKTWKDCPWLRK